MIGGCQIAAVAHMSEEDREYFYRRAVEEIAKAQACVEEEAVQFHYTLGGLYLDRVFGEAGDDAEVEVVPSRATTHYPRTERVACR